MAQKFKKYNHKPLGSVIKSKNVFIQRFYCFIRSQNTKKTLAWRIPEDKEFWELRSLMGPSQDRWHSSIYTLLFHFGHTCVMCAESGVEMHFSVLMPLSQWCKLLLPSALNNSMPPQNLSLGLFIPFYIWSLMAFF